VDCWLAEVLKDEWVEGRKFGETDGWLDGLLEGRNGGWTDG
jgi:hypothetical protein